MALNGLNLFYKKTEINNIEQLLNCYSSHEFLSPFRSTIPLIHQLFYNLDTIKQIKLDDIHAFLSYLTTTYHSKAATRARKTSSIRVFFNYLCAKANLIDSNPAHNLETPKLDKRLPK